MKSINEILSLEPSEVYTLMTSRKKPFKKSIEETEKEYDPYSHKVMNPLIRKKKRIKVPTGLTDHKTGEAIYKEKVVDRCRVCVPMQQVLTERPVGFLFSIPVEYKMTNKATEEQTELFNRVLRVFHDNKMKYADKKIARALFRECECAELWYFIYDKNGEPTDLRMRILSRLNGDLLYPHYDEYDRLDGFARQYYLYDADGTSERHFDVYTEEYVYQYIGEGASLKLIEGSPKRHGFTKIPVIYYRQEETEWNKVQPIIERIEELLSNWGDTNDYFGTPSYFIKGKLNGFAEKGEVGRVYSGENGAEMNVLSWDNSPQSVTGELANLINIVFSYTQTPDISFENMKTLGNNTSGTAIKLMFTDPHMKANVKIETFGELFTRRYNLVQNGVITSIPNNGRAFAPSLAEEIDVEPVFTPYFPKNDYENVQILSLATGGKATMSQEEGVKQNALNSNPQVVLDQIKTEEQASMMQNAFGGAM